MLCFFLFSAFGCFCVSLLSVFCMFCGLVFFAIETSSGSRYGVFSESNNRTGNKVDSGILKKSGPVVLCCILGVSWWLLKSGMVKKAWVAKALAASRVLFLPAAAAICLLNFNLSVGAISTAWILQVLK